MPACSIRWLAASRRGGEIVLAGFYSEPLSFRLPACLHARGTTARRRANGRPADLVAVTRLIAAGALSLDGLITHRQRRSDGRAAYRTAFTDPACLKMILDWRMRMSTQ